MKKYGEKWESEPNFAGWLKPVAGSDGKAFCERCNIELVAEITVLIKTQQGQKTQGKFLKKSSADTKSNHTVLAEDIGREKTGKSSENSGGQADRVFSRAQHRSEGHRPSGGCYQGHI